MTARFWQRGSLTVEAVKIAFVSEHVRCLIPEDPDVNPIRVTEEWFSQHGPETGGYFLTLENGLSGFMPAQAFESEFTPLP